jgi:hypothetical protein
MKPDPIAPRWLLTSELAERDFEQWWRAFGDELAASMAIDPTTARAFARVVFREGEWLAALCLRWLPSTPATREGQLPSDADARAVCSTTTQH